MDRAAAIACFSALAVLAALPARPLDPVVMLGDSLVAQWSWRSWCSKAVNMGRNSGTSADMLADIRKAESLKPQSAVIMIGVNDLAHNIPADDTVANIQETVTRLRSAGTARVMLYQILPVTDLYSRPGYNARIQELNRAIAKVHGVEHIQLSIPAKHYDGDGIHLRPAGYRIWLASLEKANWCLR